MPSYKNEKAQARAFTTGLKAVHLRERGSRMGIFGIVARAGSCFDPHNHPGLAHFVEHTVFKGTVRRSSWHILNRMERVGGELNAYTGKEYMVIYSLFPAGNESRAVELVADLVTNSIFPEKHLENEKDVVIEEINSYLDTPSEKIFDDFEDLLFAGTPLGHNILGNETSVKKLDSAMCRDFLLSRFAADNMALFYSGPASAERFFTMAEKYFDALPLTASGSMGKFPEINSTKFDTVQIEPSGHQANVLSGISLGKLTRQQRTTMALVSNLLGGPGMNSLLNISLREKYGLVYTVETAFNSLSMDDWFTVYYACDPEETARCRSLVSRCIEGLAEQQVSSRSLAAMKKQFAGQLTIGWENRENEATELAKFYLNHDRLASHRETLDLLDNVTAEDIRLVATRLTSLSTLTITSKAD